MKEILIDRNTAILIAVVLGFCTSALIVSLICLVRLNKRFNVLTDEVNTMTKYIISGPKDTSNRNVISRHEDSEELKFMRDYYNEMEYRGYEKT